MNLQETGRDQVCQNCGDIGSGWSMSPFEPHPVIGAWLCDKCDLWLHKGIGWDPTHRYFARRAERDEMWNAAMQKTLIQLWSRGMIRCV